MQEVNVNLHWCIDTRKATAIAVATGRLDTIALQLAALLRNNVSISMNIALCSVHIPRQNWQAIGVRFGVLGISTM